MNKNEKIEQLYNFISGDEDARVCKDIAEAACHHQPKNFIAYTSANIFNKIADELSSAKLVLPWLMASLGAPASLTGLLVPIREAGVLLPQMLVAAAVRHLPKRKGVWLMGGALSAIALALMALVAATLDGTSAGWTLIFLLIIFSLARGLCSVSAKDVLGKTISKSRRGMVMGWSAGISGVGVLLAGLWMAGIHYEQDNIQLIIGLYLASAVLWLFAIFAFAQIEEHPGATEGGGNAFSVALQHLNILKTDIPFRQLVLARSLLLALTLMPPYFVLLAQQFSGGDIAGLGGLIIATGLGASVSSPLWGRWGDHCSRCVIATASSGAGLLGLLTTLAVYFDYSIIQQTGFWSVVIFIFTILLSGANLGRKVYLVDLATAETRAAYVAVSNTVMGVLMLITGIVLGVINAWVNTIWILLILTVMCLLAALFTIKLKDTAAHVN